jgi:hypothetical protein
MARMRPFVKEVRQKPFTEVTWQFADSNTPYFELQVLSKTYLFQNLTADQINFVAAMLDKQTLYPKDTYIIHEGDEDRSLFLIEKGSVRLVR